MAMPNFPPPEAAEEEPQHLDAQQADALGRQVRRLLAEDGGEDEAVGLLRTLHPADQGALIEDLSHRQQRTVAAALQPLEMARVIEHLDPEAAADFLPTAQPEALAKVLEAAEPDVAADVLRQLTAQETEATLESMENPGAVRQLLEHKEDTAGALMTVDVPTVRADSTAGNALDTLRLRHANDSIGTLMAVDQAGRLVGTVGAVRLALARPGALVSDLMESTVVSVTSDADRQECVRLAERYGLAQLPVVDRHGHLLGVILGEDLVDVVQAEATEDMYRMAGVSGERIFGPVRASVRARLPWLIVNLATVLLAAVVVGLFESTIAKVVALAVFLPVIAGQGAVGGVQTLTLVVRSLALGELKGNRAQRLLVREAFLGMVHGLALALIVGLLAYAWKRNAALSAVVGVAMLGNMVVAGLAGAAVPLALRALKLDPAVSASVFVTTFTDVLGFVILLGLATLLIGVLL
jgi:magnesium transporter